MKHQEQFIEHPLLCVRSKAYMKRRETKMSKQKIRIRLKAFDHNILDQSAEKIVEQLSQQEQRLQVQYHYQQKKKLLLY